MRTLADLASNAAARRFIGRETQVDRFRKFLVDRQAIGMLNYWGYPGMGKTSLLFHLSEVAAVESVSSMVLDLRVQTTPWAALADLRDQLPGSLGVDRSVDEFDEIVGRIEELKPRILEAIREAEPHVGGSAWNPGDAGEFGGAALGGIAESALGIPLLGLFSSSAGRALAQKASELFESELGGTVFSADDLELLAGAPMRLSQLIADALNERAEQGESCALFVDHYEHSTPPTERWLREQVFPVLSVGVRPIVFSRRSLSLLAGWEQLAPVIEDVELKAFSQAESQDFWTARGVSDPVRVEHLVKVTGGHPYKSEIVHDIVSRDPIDTLSAIDSLRESVRGIQIDQRLMEKYLSEVDPETREMLIRSAVPRWFDRDLLFGIDPESASRYDLLSKVSFIESTPRGGVAMHSLAREAILHQAASSSPVELRETHLKIADHLRTRRHGSGALGAEHLGDETYHRLCHGEEAGMSFAILAIADARRLGLRGIEEIVWAELATFDFSSANGHAWNKLALAHRLVRDGEWVPAGEHVGELAKLSWPSDEFGVWLSELQRELLVGSGNYADAFDLEESILSTMDHSQSSEHLANDLIELRARHVETAAILSRYENAFMALDSGLSKALDNDLATARLSLAGATACRLSGKLDRGIELADQALAIYRNVADASGISFALIQAARLKTHSGEWFDAERQLIEAERLEGLAPDAYNRANTWLFRGNIMRKRGLFDDALSLYERSLGLHLPMKSNREIGPLYGSLGLIYTALEDFESAKSYLNLSLEIKESQQYRRGVGITHRYFGIYHVARGDFGNAMTSFSHARSIGDECGVPYLVYWSALGQMRCDLMFGEIDQMHERWPLIDDRSTIDLDACRKMYVGAAAGNVSETSSGLVQLFQYNPYWAYEVVDTTADDWRRAAIAPSRWEELLSEAMTDDVRRAEAESRRREQVYDDVPDLKTRL